MKFSLAATQGSEVLGNDHNDLDLLRWAGRERAFVVANAAPELKTRYRSVASNDDQGFAQAVAALLA